VADVEFHVDALPTPLDRDAPPKMQRLYRAFLGDPGARYEEEVGELDALVRSTDPLRLLAAMSHGHGFFPAGVDPESTLISDALTQGPLEWLQGFCLRFDLEDYTLGTGVGPAAVRGIGARLARVVAASGAEWFRGREERFGRESSEQIDGSWEQQQARISAMAVRNWSYRPHMVTIVTQLCEPLDGWFERELGYPVSAVPDLLFRLEEETERRVNRRRRAIRTVKEHSASAIGMCIRWQQSDLPGAERARDLELGLRQGRLTDHEFGAEFDREIDQERPAAFTFSIGELATLSGGRFTREGLERLVASLSYRFGDLRQTPAEHLILGNPVWTRPFIALEDGTYFCPLPSMGLSHLLDLVRNLVVGDDDDAEQVKVESEQSRRWTEARSAFLERRTNEILTQAFPSAAIYPNSKYDDPPVGVDLENDHAVVLDDVALAVEAKLHRASAAAWRGAPGGMRRSFERMVLEAATQSVNFVNYLLRIKGPRPFWRKGGGEFVIDSSNIRSAVRATVVLDPFPVARNMNLLLREARLLREGDPEPPPTIQLAALEAVVLVLPDELQRMHYLARRQVLQSRCLMHADEHDLLALYLDTGFNLPELEDAATFIAFDVPLAEKEVDPYLVEWFAGRVRRESPKRRLQPAWRNLLRWLQTNRPPDWVTIGMALLDASAKQQQDMSEQIAGAVRTVRTAGGPSPIVWWTMDVGLSYWRSMIVGVVTKNLAPEDRRSFVFDLVERHGLNETCPCAALLFDVAVDRKSPAGVLFFPAKSGEVP
jgi:hypothetical protein